MQSFLELQNVIFAFEKDSCVLRRGLKINEKKETTRLLLFPSNVAMTFRMGFILHWECGVLIQVTVVQEPWQGFLEELTASDDNRKLDQHATNSMKKSVGSAHHNWRRISDLVVDAYVSSPECTEGGDVASEEVFEVMRFVHSDDLPDTPDASSPPCSATVQEEDECVVCGDEAIPPDNQSLQNTAAVPSGVDNFTAFISSDESIFNGSFMDDIEIDIDFTPDGGSKKKEETPGKKTKSAKSQHQPEEPAVEKRRIRFDTTVKVLLISERCELISPDEVFYNHRDLKAFQIDLGDAVSKIQREHRCKFEVATKIYFCNTPEEIEEVKNSAAADRGDVRKKILKSASLDLSPKREGSEWYPGKHLPLVRLLRKRLKKKAEEKAIRLSNSNLTLKRGSSLSLGNYAEVEGRISEIRSVSFGSSGRGRDPEAAKFVLTVKVICGVNLFTGNPSINKLLSTTHSVKVSVGNESFTCPVESHKSPIVTEGSTFLFSVSVDESTQGNIVFAVYSTALTKSVVGKVRIPFVAIKTRYDSCQPSHLILPLTTTSADFTSIGRGFYCRSSDAMAGEESEESSFMSRMFKINRLSPTATSYNVAKLPKLHVEITKVDVSGNDSFDKFLLEDD